MADKNKKDNKKNKEEIEKNTKKAARDMALEYGPFIIIILCILICRIFIATPVRVNGTSMLPTLEEGDMLILYKLKKNVKGVHRNEVVVVSNDGEDIIKRVIGEPGETIKYEITNEDGNTKGVLYVDGKVVEEPYLDDNAKAATCIRNNDLCGEGVTLGENEYFVMGDNRRVSHDSRYFGPVSINDIKGIVEIRYFPFSKMGNFQKNNK